MFKSCITTPDAAIASPAMTWAWCSSQCIRRSRSPWYASVTSPSMVATVTTPNVAVTSITTSVPIPAAGIIRSGINGSQGPKTKMTNRLHAVIAAVADCGEC